MYKEKPIDKISVAQVSDAAGVHRSTFYFHYKDSYEIREEIESELLDDLQALDVKNIDIKAEDKLEGMGCFSSLSFLIVHTSVIYREVRNYFAKAPYTEE